MGPPLFLEQTDLVAQLLPGAIALLENDFRTSGMDVQLSGKKIPDVFALRDEVAVLVAKTGGAASEQLYRLLYRADIPETKMREALRASLDNSFESVIAELLIIRALQKAYFRREFR